MFRYQILIEYVGTNFRGWQVQKKGKTIQGLLQEKISKLLKEKILLFGSGRTDTGVHAIEQSAHFDCKNQIKETDRLVALERELKKLGATIKITESSLILSPGNNFKQNCSISTYNDHRMAMSFAPLSLKIPIQIKDHKVVSKSYPNFWKDLVKLNFIIQMR